VLVVNRLVAPSSEPHVHRQWFLSTLKVRWKGIWPDCAQVVIAPIVTTDGFPLASEVMNSNTIDSITLSRFLDKIENTYGKARRMWVMDRGDFVSAEHTEEPDWPAREALVEPAMAERPQFGGSESIPGGRRIVCAGQERGSPGQGDYDAAREAGPVSSGQWVALHLPRGVAHGTQLFAYVAAIYDLPFAGW